MCDCVLLRKPGGTCSYVSHHYKSQCSQVYNYHRLLSWDKGRGLHMDIYKVDLPQHIYISNYLHLCSGADLLQLPHHGLQLCLPSAEEG